MQPSPILIPRPHWPALFAAACCALLCHSSTAQPRSAAIPEAPDVAAPTRPVVSFSVTCSTEVPQDLSRVSLSFHASSASPQSVQTLLKRNVTAILNLSRPSSISLGSAQISANPLFDLKGKTTSWAGQATLLATSTDAPALSSFLADSIAAGAAISSISYDVSPLSRATEHSKMISSCVSLWRSRAQVLAKAIGAPSFDIKDISLLDSAPTPPPVFARAMAMASPRLESDTSPVPLAPGSESLSISVQGSILLRPAP